MSTVLALRTLLRTAHAAWPALIPRKVSQMQTTKQGKLSKSKGEKPCSSQTTLVRYHLLKGKSRASKQLWRTLPLPTARQWKQNNTPWYCSKKANNPLFVTLSHLPWFQNLSKPRVIYYALPVSLFQKAEEAGICWNFSATGVEMLLKLSDWRRQKRRPHASGWNITALSCTWQMLELSLQLLHHFWFWSKFQIKPVHICQVLSGEFRSLMN